MNFLYFIEGIQHATVEQLCSYGLGYVFDKKTQLTNCRFDGSGPGGTQGVVVATDDKRIGYRADVQTWRRIPRKFLETDTPIYVGYFNDAKPNAKSLQRPTLLDGEFVELRDGGNWLVPIARSWSESGGHWVRRLPGSMGLDEDGNLTMGSVDSRYEWLWSTATKWFETRQESTVQQCFESAVRVLQANYRIGIVEAIMLGLIDDLATQAVAILDVTTDAKTVIEWSQKKILEISDTTDGAQVLTEAIDQQLRKCG